ncbi:MAG: PEF-CTERM sorting domain-containing protein [Methanosarcina sp.]
MKLKYILGLLVSLFILTNVASAVIDPIYIGKTFVMDHDSTNTGTDAVNIEYVTATIVDATHVKFHVEGKGSSPTGYFKIVGLPVSMKVPLKSDGKTPIDGAVSNEQKDLTSSEIKYTQNDNLGGLSEPGAQNKITFNTENLQKTGINGQTQQYYDNILIEITSDSTFNPNTENSYFGAHCGWEPTVNGLGSAFFFGNKVVDVSVPEFPTMVLPVAAILGILVILGRRKQD